MKTLLIASPFAQKPATRRNARRLLAMLLPVFWLWASIGAQAQESARVIPATPMADLPAALPPPPINPALDIANPQPEPAPPTLMDRWWFWPGVGVVTAATVLLIVVSRGQAPPASDLGNQEFKP